MTRDEAIQYIRSHPAMFKGSSEPEILSKTQSSNDPNYYDPTLFDPEQKATVVKPNTATRGATVGPSRPSTPAKSTAVAKVPAPPPQTGKLPVSNALIGKLSGANALPWILGFMVLGLGAGMAVYKAAR